MLVNTMENVAINDTLTKIVASVLLQVSFGLGEDKSSSRRAPIYRQVATSQPERSTHNDASPLYVKPFYYCDPD